MVDQNENEESFAEMFEQSLKTERRRVSPGEKITGTVVQVGENRALLDMGDGLDGMIDLAELAPSRGVRPDLKIGDKVEAFVIKLENRVAVLGKTLGKGAGSRRAIEDAHRTGIPVEGTVLEVNKGGYVVDIHGARAFCPLGQMDTRRIEDPATMIGKRLHFVVTEMRDSRDAVVSRRVLLEEEAASKAKGTRDRLAVGARFNGVVTSIREFGAFVDIGGIEALMPASEMGFGRVRVQDVVQPGQEVEVEVIKIEAGDKSSSDKKKQNERITLSMRSMAVDPWDQVVADLPPGTVVRGKVVRIQPFGAFVEIVPGVDGLLHVSAFGKRVGSPADVVAVGQEIAVRVDAVEPSQRRISLAYVEPADAEAMANESAALAALPAESMAAAASAAPSAPSASGASNEPRAKTRRTLTGNEPMPGATPAAAPTPAPAAAAATAPSTASKPAADTSSKSKARVLGHRAPVEPTVESLAAPAPEQRPRPAPSAAPRMGDVLEVTVDKIETFGLFVKWATGRGLVPHSELDVPKGADLRKSYPIGTVFKAAVVDVRGDGKVRLSATAAVQAEERAEAAEWMDKQPKQEGAGKKGFGTLADLLSKFKK